ncbi:MAG: sugar ABC transporter permease [Microbacterium sp.]|nr:sugar ABC transporter permease [Microbacterium sp.]
MVRTRRWWVRRQWVPYLLVLPFVALFAVFFIAPLVGALTNSLFTKKLIGGTTFVGLENYARVLTDASFLGSLGRIVLYAVIAIPVAILIPLILALVADSGVVPRQGLFQTLFFLPYAIPSVIATLMWGFLYGPTISPFTDIAGWFGIDLNLVSKDLILPSIANIGIWLAAGYNMIVFYSALKSVPPETVEAARLDGAGPMRIALSIKTRMIFPVVSTIVIFSIIGTLQLFAEPQVLQTIAPTVITSDFTPNLYAYSLAASGQQMNYVSAMTFVIGAIVIAFSVVYLRVTRRYRDVS